MTKTITPGVVLTIRGQDIALSPDDYTNVEGAGISYTLDHPVDLGTPGDLAAFISDAFGAGGTIPDFTKLPSPLDGIATRLATLDIAVEAFQLTVSPTKNADGTAIATPAPNTYTVGLSGTWPGDPISLFSGALKIKGVFLKVVEDGKTA